MAQQAAAAPKRRQARGERRMAELLDAAGQVFAESGYSATTTNAIAARAGVSPGTLYQYFPNKDAMADALAGRFAEQLVELRGLLAVPDPAALPLDELLPRVLRPILRFHRENPACPVLFMGPGIPQRLADMHEPLHASMLAGVADLIRLLAPGLPEADLRRAAEVSVYLFKGSLPLVIGASPEELPAMEDEIVRALLAYFRDVVGSPGGS
ncbi:TetR/AcrR family transcriptional regulator [Streptacidiphilus cavernicola]|uniref:TetR/AcrR family transcriptional regulator n=1 Tax=Streptacidiphilus cavernicola TaxID=3342716 RepID=A0ABV6W1M1_9ACTN